MKKTLKSILAITLALIMSFGTLTVFAAEGDTLKWYHDNVENSAEFVKYEFFGNLTEGVNVISTDTDVNSRYYTMDTKEGYYLFTMGELFHGSYIWNVITPKKLSNGIAHGTKSTVLDWWEILDEENEEYQNHFIYKFNAGENIIGVDVVSVPGYEAPELTIEYLGENITDFDVETEEFIKGHDVHLEESEGWVFADFDVRFSEEKTVSVKNNAIFFTCNEIAEGENIFTFEIEGLKKDFTLTVNSIDRYIESAELSNAEKHSEVFVDYNGGYSHHSINNEILTITFTDSTKQEVLINYNSGTFSLPNGKEYEVYLRYNKDSDDKYYLCINTCGEAIKKYECTVTQCNLAEDGQALINDIKSNFRRFFNRLSDALGDATYYNTIFEIFESLFGSFFDTLINASDLFGGIFENIVSFIKFYLVG